MGSNNSRPPALKQPAPPSRSPPSVPSPSPKPRESVKPKELKETKDEKLSLPKPVPRKREVLNLNPEPPAIAVEEETNIRSENVYAEIQYEPRYTDAPNREANGETEKKNNTESKGEQPQPKKEEHYMIPTKREIEEREEREQKILHTRIAFDAVDLLIVECRSDPGAHQFQKIASKFKSLLDNVPSEIIQREISTAQNRCDPMTAHMIWSSFERVLRERSGEQDSSTDQYLSCEIPSCPNSRMSEKDLYICRQCPTAEKFCGPHCGPHIDHSDQVVTVLESKIDEDITKFEEPFELFKDYSINQNHNFERIELREASAIEILKALNDSKWSKIGEIEKLKTVIDEIDRFEKESQIVRIAMGWNVELYKHYIDNFSSLTSEE